MSNAGAREEKRMDAAKSGDVRARDTLFREHWRGVWSQSFAMTGSRTQAEDITQDAFERAFRTLDRVGTIESFGAWVRRIAANRTIDLFRRAEKEAGHPPEEVAVEWAEPGDQYGVRKIVARLPVERRAVIALRFWLDMTPTEIAALFDLPVGTVNSRLGRALDQLRDELGDADA